MPHSCLKSAARPGTGVLGITYCSWGLNFTSVLPGALVLGTPRAPGPSCWGRPHPTLLRTLEKQLHVVLLQGWALSVPACVCAHL